MKRCDTGADTISKSRVQQQAGRDDTTLGGATALQSITCSQRFMGVAPRVEEIRRRQEKESKLSRLVPMSNEFE